MVGTLGAMWMHRHLVVDAYAHDDGPNELRFGGVELEFEKTELPASPYVVHTAVDTRRRPLGLLATDVDDAEPVTMVGGEARIRGTVLVDGEPAVGGVVRLERHTSDGVGARDVLISGDGRFSARNLPGGRYRVRAWQPGVATMTASDVFFLEADGTAERRFTLTTVAPTSSIEFVNGGTMYLGMNGSFGAIVSRRQVDEHGVIVTSPVAGVPIAVQFSPHVISLSAPNRLTDGRGLAEFTLRCARIGSGFATVTFETQTYTVALPECRTIPPTTAPPVANAPSPQPGAGGGPAPTAPATGSGPGNAVGSTTQPAPPPANGNAGGGNG